jgi:hypothetical protein
MIKYLNYLMREKTMSNKIMETWITGTPGKIAVTIFLLGAGPIGWIIIAGLWYFHFKK